MDKSEEADSLTIIISALNEEDLIEVTVKEILDVSRSALQNFELILVNDGSSDRTGEIMDDIQKNNDEVMVIHNESACGLGQAFCDGVDRAKYDKAVIFVGDREISVAGIKNLYEAVGKADLVLGYRDNQYHARLFKRYIISKIFRIVMVLLFGYKIRDFHGIPIYPVKLVRELDLKLIGYTFQVEVIVKLLRRNVAFVEVPFSINEEEEGRSQVFRMKTLKDFFSMIVHLFRK